MEGTLSSSSSAAAAQGGGGGGRTLGGGGSGITPPPATNTTSTGSRSTTPTTAAAHAQSHSHSSSASINDDSRFECNICLETVQDPVVTLCGHLFCWPCLYRWLTSNHNMCPVCKAGVTKENVIPLYGRGSEQVDPRTKSGGRRGGGGAGGGGVGRGGGGDESEPVPGRPAAQRPEARPQASTFIGGAPGFMGGIPFGNAFGTSHHYMGGPGAGGGMGGGMGGGGVSFSAGFGFFPSLFGLQFQTFTPPAPVSNGGGGAGGSGSAAMTADEAQQAFLSKLLLMLGIFTLGVLVFC